MKSVVYDPKGSMDGILVYRLFYHYLVDPESPFILRHIPLDLPPTIQYSRGDGWYEFLGMPPDPPRVWRSQCG